MKRSNMEQQAVAIDSPRVRPSAGMGQQKTLPSFRGGAVVFAFLCAAACGGDDPEGSTPTPRDGSDTDSKQCEELDTEHLQLLNAPTDAVVVKKTPTHPDAEED